MFYYIAEYGKITRSTFHSTFSNSVLFTYFIYIRKWNSISKALYKLIYYIAYESFLKINKVCHLLPLINMTEYSSYNSDTLPYYAFHTSYDVYRWTFYDLNLSILQVTQYIELDYP